MTELERAAVEGEVLTPADEFRRYVQTGVAPSLYAIRRALGEERAVVLAALDELGAVANELATGPTS